MSITDEQFGQNMKKKRNQNPTPLCRLILEDGWSVLVHAKKLNPQKSMHVNLRRGCGKKKNKSNFCQKVSPFSTTNRKVILVFPSQTVIEMEISPETKNTVMEYNQKINKQGKKVFFHSN
jgi:hypothetical protein